MLSMDPARAPCPTVATHCPSPLAESLDTLHADLALACAASAEHVRGVGGGQEQHVGRMFIVVTEPVFSWSQSSSKMKTCEGQGECPGVTFTSRSDPLAAAAEHVELGSPGTVHWVCMAPTDGVGGRGSLDPQLHLHPVPIPVHTQALWLGEYAHLLLWPALHSLLQPTGSGGLPPFSDVGAHAAAWAATQEGTAAFAMSLASIVQSADTVLIADPALMLLPDALRQAVASGPSPRSPPTLVYVMLTPFPSPEVWRCLPARSDLLQGVLGSDLVVLQGFQDARHLASACQQVLGLEARPAWVACASGGRFAALSVLPLGIDPAQFDPAIPEVSKHARAFAQAIGATGRTPPSTPLRIITAIDSLDMSRGIPQKLLGYDTLLASFAEHREKVVLLLVVPPEPEDSASALPILPYPEALTPPCHVTEADVYGYGTGTGEGGPAFTTPCTSTAATFQHDALKRTVHELVGRINGAYGTSTWVPVRMLRARLTAAQRAGLYSVSAVGFLASAREGLTYEALEYVAAQEEGEGGEAAEEEGGHSGPGVLLYSDFAGAAAALRGALTVNPFDTVSVGAALHQALTMPTSDRLARIGQVRKFVQATAAGAWAARLLVLSEAAGRCARERMPARPLPVEDIIHSYTRAGQERGRRMFVFSYNGTLRPYASRLEYAAPSPRIRLLIARLASDESNTVWVISGDASAMRMDAWLGDLPIGLAAESGYRYRYPPPPPHAARIAFSLLPALMAAAGGHGEGSPTTVVETAAADDKATPHTSPAPVPSLKWQPPPVHEWHTLTAYGTREGWPEGQGSAQQEQPPTTIRPRVATPPNLSWLAPVRKCLEFFTARTPGTSLTVSEASLLWSYADAQPSLEHGEAVARDVLAHLDAVLYGQQAEVLPAHAKRFLCVRPIGVSKGALMARLLSVHGGGRKGPPPFSFLFVVGDERTDEELYPHARALGPGQGWAVALAAPTIGAKAVPVATYGPDWGAPWLLPCPDAVLDALESLPLPTLPLPPL